MITFDRCINDDTIGLKVRSKNRKMIYFSVGFERELLFSKFKIHWLREQSPALWVPTWVYTLQYTVYSIQCILYTMQSLQEP